MCGSNFYETDVTCCMLWKILTWLSIFNSREDREKYEPNCKEKLESWKNWIEICLNLNEILIYYLEATSGLMIPANGSGKLIKSSEVLWIVSCKLLKVLSKSKVNWSRNPLIFALSNKW